MSNKSGTSNQVISLPKGGGALQGIGETFSPDLHTGTGNFSVPITLPPGRNGFQPELKLVYSTGTGNGPFGLGWSLSIPGVVRKTSHGLPRYQDTSAKLKERDTFILSGAEDLVAIEDMPAKTCYRPRTEGLFAQIEHQHDVDSQQNYWEIHSKDGLVSFYGTPRPLDADHDWRDPAAVTAPNDFGKVFAWQLTQTVDPFGNRIIYEYERDTDQDQFHRWDQLYLKRIRYVDYTNAEGQEQFLVLVNFNYGPRPDPYSEYRAGFEIRTHRRCTSVEILTNADQEHLVRTYRLVYLDQRDDLPNLDQLLPLNRVSLLSRIEVTGHDSDGTEAMPPLEFGYTRFQPEGRRFFPLGGRELPDRSLASSDLELADLFGNGLPDIFQMNGVVRYWQNLGGGRFAPSRLMEDAPAGLTLTDSGVQLIDADGDGRIDLLTIMNGQAGYFSLTFSGRWDRRSFQRYRVAPSFNLEDPEVKLIDLDGDGVTDAIRSGSRFECYFNHPKEGWRQTRWVERQTLENFPNVDFSDSRVKWADMTGDGLQDILLVYNGCVEYWPSLGYGNWCRRVQMKNSPHFPYGYDPRRVLVGDVDGDGLADLIYIDDKKVTLWINQSGNGWSAPIEIKGTPSVSDMDAVRLVDILGSGISSVLWSSDATGLSRANMFFLDFTGGVKPYLLNEMNNHMGAVTRVEYRPSTYYYLEDSRQRETRWQTPLPFPVQVVARVEVIDQISQGKLTTEYRYHHGYRDGAEREFRGFGMVEQYDTEVFTRYNASGLHGDARFNAVEEDHFSPPTLTKTWFHLGPMGEEFGEWAEADYSHEFWPNDPPVLERPQALMELLKTLPRRAKRDALRALRGRILRTELYALDGTERQDRPYTITEHLYGLREESPPAGSQEDRPRIFFPHPLAERTTQWERGDEPMTSFSFTGDYDAYGQPRSQISIAVPRRRDFRMAAESHEPYLATQTVTGYAQPDGFEPYIVTRVAHTTQYEIINDGSLSVFELLGSIEAGLAERRVIGQTLTYYDGRPFQGLPLGQIGSYGVMVRSERLVLTEDILQTAYSSDSIPPYLSPDTPPIWTAEYPEPFRKQLPEVAGYIYRSAEEGSPHATGYYTLTERRQYDFHDHSQGVGRGLIRITRDPLGNDISISYDAYHLLPGAVENAVGLTTEANYDYRLLQVQEAIDSNGNHTFYTFSPLGLLTGIALQGKKGEGIGDILELGTRFQYDFLAFSHQGQPVWVHTIQRVYHDSDNKVPLPERDETIEKVEYSDGFGRLLQSRAQAEDIIFDDEVLPADQTQTPGPTVGRKRSGDEPLNVVVSGWQVYDNKGRVVEKYEPFFSTGWDYAPPAETQLGQKVTMYYDPRGQLIRTINPNGSEQRVIYGIPDDLADPEHFRPTPWEAYTYDLNDNAGRTHPTPSLGYSSHWNTPANIVVDVLGRMVKSVVRNGPDPSHDWHVTQSSYDIRGNLLSVTDALGRLAFQYVYDLGDNPLRIENIDAGRRQIVLDAAGKEIERRDSKGALILQSYDCLSRLSRVWARDDGDSQMTLREQLVYGDGGSPEQSPEEREASRANNLLGKLYQHYDEAGHLTFEVYDFKGNLLEKTRQVIRDDQISADFRVNWQVQSESDSLSPTLYQVSFNYDALNRIKTMHYPEDVEGKRHKLCPHYDRAGALERVEVDDATYVAHIAYNAKGQRILIAYGNGLMTRYAYDLQTFHLVRLRTERYKQSEDAPFVYLPSAPHQPLQDFAYDYDLTGNILQIHDRTPECGLPAQPNRLDRAFSYDPIYRLLSATGRECDQPQLNPWDNSPRCTDLTRTRPYAEHYEYDPAGNITQMQHLADGGSFTRLFALVPGNNRLATVNIGDRTYNYAYDTNGNMTQETTSRHFAWDHRDRLRSFRTQAKDAEPSLEACYLYDTDGQRVKKLVHTSKNHYEVTVYMDGVFEHRYQVRGDSRHEHNILHIMDDQQRIALVRVGDPFLDDKGAAVQYHLGDHLGSSNVVIDESGNWTNREEYTPFGETSFGGFTKKRYRFSGKGLDGESGLGYYEMRYYSPWLAKWISCDPIFFEVLSPQSLAVSQIENHNFSTYSTFRSNPIVYVDLDGRDWKTVVRAIVLAWSAFFTKEHPSPRPLPESREGQIEETSRRSRRVATRQESSSGQGPDPNQTREPIERGRQGYQSRDFTSVRRQISRGGGRESPIRGSQIPRENPDLRQRPGQGGRGPRGGTAGFTSPDTMIAPLAGLVIGKVVESFSRFLWGLTRLDPEARVKSGVFNPDPEISRRADEARFRRDVEEADRANADELGITIEELRERQERGVRNMPPYPTLDLPHGPVRRYFWY